MFAGDHPNVTGYRFAIGEALRITKKNFGGQRRDRSHSWMRHQSSRLYTLLGGALDLAIQIVDRSLQLRIQRQQRIALRAGMRRERQSPQRVLASAGPQGVDPPQSVT